MMTNKNIIQTQMSTFKDLTTFYQGVNVSVNLIILLWFICQKYVNQAWYFRFISWPLAIHVYIRNIVFLCFKHDQSQVIFHLFVHIYTCNDLGSQVGKALVPIVQEVSCLIPSQTLYLFPFLLNIVQGALP